MRSFCPAALLPPPYLSSDSPHAGSSGLTDGVRAVRWARTRPRVIGATSKTKSASSIADSAASMFSDATCRASTLGSAAAISDSAACAFPSTTDRDCGRTAGATHEATKGAEPW